MARIGKTNRLERTESNENANGANRNSIRGLNCRIKTEKRGVGKTLKKKALNIIHPQARLLIILNVLARLLTELNVLARLLIILNGLARLLRELSVLARLLTILNVLARLLTTLKVLAPWRISLAG